MRLPRAASPLAHAPLRAYLAGNFASVVGTWGQRVVLLWLAWDITQSTFMLGLMAMADLLPSVIVAPFAGSLVDRKDRLRLARQLQVMSLAPPCMMLVATLTGLLNPAMLLAVATLTGVVNGFDHPVRMVVVGGIVPQPDVPGAVAMNSVVFNLARMLGPAVGGVTIALHAMWAIFIFNAVSYLIFALILSRLSRRRADSRSLSPEETGVASARPETARTRAPSRGEGEEDGWSTVWRGLTRRHKVLLVLFAFLALCFRPIFELLPTFAESLALSDAMAARAFSLMTSAQGAGAMIGAVVASVLLSRGRHLTLALGFAVAGVLGCGGFLLSNFLWVALVALTFLSGVILANGICTQVVLQTEVPDQIRGKVLSLYTMIFRGLPALGAMSIGMIADTVSERKVFAIACLLVLAIVLVLSPVLRHEASK
ncbi:MULTISPECIES: MFS transporter [unclassified Halomonas]|uniref:MFS transporter n=1 Tax=unclassified Halomonas TaxID=2609666 RepID=UPI0006DA55E1|nr:MULTISPECIES: MFS transporter [unclassified Halomonas]KPQ20506.1 MAG: Arabinose efflux permease [Halomonas sp. HL-93]SBR46587.1 Predicted arabinose efflux permease, MFS family [Halomonas sp. HL-93]SNY98819.1 Predicted arabinose efflux permease, MFS family [Halomonas sp. hl-4]